MSGFGGGPPRPHRAALKNVDTIVNDCTKANALPDPVEMAQNGALGGALYGSAGFLGGPAIGVVTTAGAAAVGALTAGGLAASDLAEDNTGAPKPNVVKADVARDACIAKGLIHQRGPGNY